MKLREPVAQTVLNCQNVLDAAQTALQCAVDEQSALEVKKYDIEQNLQRAQMEEAAAANQEANFAPMKALGQTLAIAKAGGFDPTQVTLMEQLLETMVSHLAPRAPFVDPLVQASSSTMAATLPQVGRRSSPGAYGWCSLASQHNRR